MLRIQTISDNIHVHILKEAPYPIRGAAIISVIAEPPCSADDQRTLNVYRALARVAADEIIKHDPNWAEKVQPWPPRILTFPLERACKIKKQVIRKLDGRLAAGCIATLRMLNEFFPNETGKAKEIRQHIQDRVEFEHSLIEFSSRTGTAWKPRFDLSPINFEHRVFRSSLPIINLCMAILPANETLSKMMLALPVDDQNKYDWCIAGLPGQWLAKYWVDPIIFLPNLQEILMEGAEIFEQYADLRFKIKQKAVRVRFA